MPKGRIHPQARELSSEHTAIIEQGLLNLALNGHVRIFLNGRDITTSAIEQAGRINQAFDATRKKKRATVKKALSSP